MRQPIKPLYRSFAVIFALWSAAASAQVAVGVGDVTGKIKSDCAPGAQCFPTATTAVLTGAGNEFVSFEVAIRNQGSAPVTGVTIAKPGNLTGTGGAIVPAGNIWLYREAFYNVVIPSSSEGSAGNWPDALIPQVDEIYGELRNGPSGFQNLASIDPNDTTCGTSCNFLPPGQTVTFLVDILVPSGLPYGNYTTAANGGVQISWIGGGASVPISLLIRNFSIPVTSSLATLYKLTDVALCTAHTGSPSACATSTEVSLLKMYGRFFLDHRITVESGIITPTYCPTGCGFSGSACPAGCAAATSADTSTTDWSAFEARFGAFFDGADDPGNFPSGAFGDGQGNFKSRLRGARPTTIPYAWPSYDQVSVSADEDSDRHRQWWNEFSKARPAPYSTWASRTVDKICDEVHVNSATNCPATTAPTGTASVWNTVYTRASSAKKLVPFPTMLTTDNVATARDNLAALQSQTGLTDATTYKKLLNTLAIVVNNVYDKNPNISGASAPSGNHRADYNDFLADTTIPHQFWWYQDCLSDGCDGINPSTGVKSVSSYFTGWPSYMIDIPETRNRVFEWLSFIYGASAEHYYDTVADLPTAWNRNVVSPTPRTIALPTAAGNGDGTLVYPGTVNPVSGSYTNGNGDTLSFRTIAIGGAHDIPIASLRLKMIRAGMQDYEYLRLTTAMGDPLFARTKAGQVFGVSNSTLDCTVQSPGSTNCPAPFAAAVATPQVVSQGRRDLGDRIDQLTSTFAVVGPSSIFTQAVAGQPFSIPIQIRNDGVVPTPLWIYFLDDFSPPHILPSPALDGGSGTAPVGLGTIDVQVGDACNPSGSYIVDVFARNTPGGAPGTKQGATSTRLEVILNRPGFTMAGPGGCGSPAQPCQVKVGPGQTASLSIATAVAPSPSVSQSIVVSSALDNSAVGSGAYSSNNFAAGGSTTWSFTASASAAPQTISNTFTGTSFVVQAGASGATSCNTATMTANVAIVPVCNSQSCGSGCCDDQGVCQAGTSSSLCGGGGNACVNCADLGETCSSTSRTCKCPAGGCF